MMSIPRIISSCWLNYGFFTISLAGGFLFGAGGCGKDCTDLGCTQSQLIRFDRVLVDPGVYVFEVTGPGLETVRCTATLPLQARATCTGGVNWIVANGDSEDVFGLEVGPGTALAGVAVGPESPTTSLRLTYEGNELYSGTLTMKYGEDFINGDDCKPCRYASQVVSLPGGLGVSIATLMGPAEPENRHAHRASP